MRSLNPAALVLCAAVLILPAARAQTVSPPATFTAFTVQSATETNGYAGPAMLSLESDGGGATVFSMPNFEGVMNVESGGAASYYEYVGSLALMQRPGYTITAIEFGGVLTGDLALKGYNSAWFKLDSGGNGEDIDFDQLDGTATFDLSATSFFMSGDTIYVELGGLVSVRAEYTYLPGGSQVPGYAFLAVSDPRLTVRWAPLPVPEPHAWMMLVGGLLPLVAWRRQRRTAAS